jgi:hypothetical protein
VVTRDEAKALGLTRFFTGKPCKHGHLSQRTACNGGCIRCNAITTQALYRIEGPEKRQRRLETTLAWIAGRKEERLAYGREWARVNKARKRAQQLANRERLNELARAARERNPELANARSARYARSPKGKLNGVMGEQRRRARKRAAEGSHTVDELKALFQRQRGKCAYCGVSIRNGYHIDHVIPLARGGSNWIANIALACAKCNLTKSATDPIEFARRNGKLL